MEALAETVEGLALAEWLRYSRWGYAAVSTIHVLGISLLIGAIVILDLRLLGLWRSIEPGPLYRALSRIAATGLIVAIGSGFLLFSVRATEYAALDLFLVKIVLVIIGTVLAALLHFGFDLAYTTRARQRLTGAVSLLLWPSVLVCGRLLAFV